MRFIANDARAGGSAGRGRRPDRCAQRERPAADEGRSAHSGGAGPRQPRHLLSAGREPCRSVPDVTDNAGKPLPKNPLHDVRGAAGAGHGGEPPGAGRAGVPLGTVEPMEQLMWPGAYSYAPGIKAPPYDPDRAKALLAEGGGILTGSASPSTPSPTDRRTCLPGRRSRRCGPASAARAGRAVARGRLHPPRGQAGVQHAGDVLGHRLRRGRGRARERTRRWTRRRAGPANWGGYSNPAFDALVEQATLHDRRRGVERLLVQATDGRRAYIRSTASSTRSKRGISEPRLLMVLIISMIINSVIGLYYYLRIITTLFATSSDTKLPELSIFGNITLVIAGISILVLGVYPGWLIDIIVRFVNL